MHVQGTLYFEKVGYTARILILCASANCRTLGICAVLNFVYRYAFVYPRTGTLGFDGTALDWATMLAHTMLAFSSIQFRVPRHRPSRFCGTNTFVCGSQTWVILISAC